MMFAAAGDALTYSSVWTAAGVVSGFVVTAYMFRIKREAEMRSAGLSYWLTPADHVLILSLSVGLVGVFVLPVLGAGLTVAKYALGWSMLLLAGYPLVAAGHYEILLGHAPEERRRRRAQVDDTAATAERHDLAASSPRAGPDRVSRQEMWSVALIAVASFVYRIGVTLAQSQ